MQEGAALPPRPKETSRGEIERELFMDTLGTLTRIANECGEMAYFELAGSKVFLPYKADYVKDILIVKGKEFLKTDGSRISESSQGRGMGSTEGELHNEQRRLVLPVFHQERVASYASTIVEHTSSVRAQWKDGQVVDMNREMMRLAMPVMVRLIFGVDMADGSKYEALRAATERLQAMHGARVGALSSLLAQDKRRLERANESFDAIVYGIIKDRRDKGREEGDILSMLLDSHESNRGRGALTDEHVRDDVFELLVAATATTPNALAWTWYLLSQNPEAEKRMHLEVDSVLGGRLPTAEDYGRLACVTQTFTEAMRIFPPTWVLGRKAVKTASVGGFTIPEGSIVLLSQYLMHHNERYFPEPERFMPERWTPEFKKNLPKVAYFPFGAGARACLGEPLAWMEGVLVLATMAQWWEPRYAGGEAEVRPTVEFSIPPWYTSKRASNSRYGFGMKFLNTRFVIARSRPSSPLTMSMRRRPDGQIMASSAERA